MIKNLTQIQNELRAPKSRFNSFGRYNYRSCEDILTAVKPLLARYGCQMTITDEIIAVGGRIYVKAIVTVTDADGNTETVSAFAREDESKKGMDGSQITGTASSYARKYALNGLFLIDDSKDADTDEYHYQSAYEATKPEPRTATPELEITKDFLLKHGTERITEREIAQLKEAAENAGKDVNNAVKACKKNAIEEISYIEFVRLMNGLRRTA